MRITNLKLPVTFGYDKKANDEIRTILTSNSSYPVDGALNSDMLVLNDKALELEDRLRETEDNQDGAYEACFNLFIPLKAALIEQLDFLFPTLNFAKREIFSYQKEIADRNITDRFHWTHSLLDHVAACYPEYLGDDYDVYDDDDDSSELSDTKSLEAVLESSLNKNKTEDSNKNTSATSTKAKIDTNVLELYEPTENSPKGFSDLGGMEEIKSSLLDKIVMPIRDPETAELDRLEYGIKLSKGELFYGPPGCGKTSIIEALSREANIPLYKLKISNVGSAYINESARNVQKAYNYAKNSAKDLGKPVFLMMDEMEALTRSRQGSDNHEEDDKVVATLLPIIEEARDNNVIILAATNFIDSVDAAIKSRFESKTYVGLPDDKTRESVLKIHLNKRSKGQSLAETPEELSKVVKLTQGFSNRDISVLVDKAARIARLDGRRDIVAEDFVKPVADYQPNKIKESLFKGNEGARLSLGFSNYNK